MSGLDFTRAEAELNRRAKRRFNRDLLPRETRQAFRVLLEESTPYLGVWLFQVAEKSPEKAIELLIKMAEFVIPKLARTESNVQVSMSLESLVLAAAAPPTLGGKNGNTLLNPMKPIDAEPVPVPEIELTPRDSALSDFL